MDYEKFIEKVKAAVEKLVGEGYEVRVHNVTKNNGVELIGLVIFKKWEREISPTLYLEDYYELYQKGLSLKEIAHMIVVKYREAVSMKETGIQDVNYMDFEIFKPFVTYRLVGYETNKKLLSESPHIRFLDWAITFHYLFPKTSEGILSFRITNGIMKVWGTTKEELYRLAEENTKRILPVKIRRMKDVVSEFAGDDEDVDDLYDPNAWIMSNDIGINGATSLLYPNALKEFAETCGADVYVIPSSVHELILSPVTNAPEPQVLRRMVKEINDSECATEDVLGYQIHLYEKDTGKFTY